MNDNFIPYAKQSIDADDQACVSASLKNQLITRGPLVEEFESAIAKYCGAQFAVAFNSGTSALMAAYHSIDTGPSDRLLTTPNTFVSTVGSGMQLQAVPIFMDIDRSTGNMDLDYLNNNLNQPFSRGKTIIVPVHFAGIAVDMQRLDTFIRHPETIVIEDAAHAIGSSYLTGEKVGSCAYSQMTIFSFHPAKTLTTGEGGMVTTNDETLYHRLKRFRNNGIEREPTFLRQPPTLWYYEVQETSGNFNFTEMQAALGISQLKRLDLFVAKRRQLIQLYRSLFKELEGVRLLTDAFDLHTAFHLCVIQIDFSRLGTNRAEFMEKLKEKGIGTQYHYIPVYRHPFFQDRSGDLSPYFPEMEAYYAQALSLPLYYDLREEDVERIVQEVKKLTLLKPEF
jgi:UDP-4-amino-4,6-dideoxy-N-acetyl-beta-L-altrosamine transaminase